MDGVGIIGVGNMGGAMARNLLKNGYLVTVHDVVESSVDALVKDGARRAGSPKEVTESCDVILVMVINDKQTTDVVTGHDGILDGARPGTVVILCSSLQPNTVASLGALAKAKDVNVLDAPVTGGEQGAIDGKLTFLVGGDEGDIERVTPVLRAMGEHIVCAGPLGAGQVVKNVNNVLLWTTLSATREALRFAAEHGMSPEAVRDALQFSPGYNRWIKDWGSLGPTPWVHKDLETTLAIANTSNVQMPIAALCFELLKDWPSVRMD